MAEQELEQLEGTVEDIIYENADNGYTVFEVSGGGVITVVCGVVGELHAGESVICRGRYENHATYGRQFHAQECETDMPKDLEAVYAFLASRSLPYIGAKTADKIIDLFGAEALEVIANDPARLTQVPGISPDKADRIQQEFKRMFGMRELIAYLAQFEIGPRKAMEVFRAFGPGAMQAISANPYLLCGEPLQLDFRHADSIAQYYHMEGDCAQRLEAALLRTLRHNAGNGHTCLPRAQLLETASNFIHQPPEKLARALDKCIETEELCVKMFDGVPYIYLPDLLAAEQDIAHRLAILARRGKNTARDLDRNLQVLELTQGFAYAPLQREAIRKAMTENCLVLTGGPGTGKTTTVNAILQLLENQAERVALCAPTGRAAKRLSELTGRKASTIHRLLEVDYTGGVVSFIHNDKNLLKCDVVILDEMSMVDVKLFQALVTALRYSCRIIMVGDADQLPSVGPGNLLGEIIRSGCVPTVCLNEIFRQAKRSLIVENAHHIICGEPLQKGGKTDDFFFLEVTGNQTLENGTGAIAVDGSKAGQADFGTVTAGSFTAADNSVVMVDGQSIKDTAAVSGVTDVTISSDSILYVDGAEKGETYKVLAGSGIDQGWADDNIISDNSLIIFNGDHTGYDNFDVTASYDKVNNVYGEGTVVIDSIVDKTLADKNAGDAAFDFFNDAVSSKHNVTKDAQAAALNSVANMGELAGVNHGTYSMSNAMTDAVAHHLSLAAHGEQDKDIWAHYIHNKEDIDGMNFGGVDGSYEAQYNGIVVGSDLYKNGKTTAGIALSYADGNINGSNIASSTKNDAEYYGASLYGRIDNGDSAILGDISYMHSDNDITQNNSGHEITASADADAFSIGIRAEQAYKAGAGKFVPYAGIRYMHLGAGDYSNSLGMEYNADDQNLWLLPVGVTYSAEVQSGDWTVKPIAEVGYVWTMGDRDTDQTVSLNGASDTFGFETADSGSFIGRLGIEAEKADVTYGRTRVCFFRKSFWPTAAAESTNCAATKIHLSMNWLKRLQMPVFRWLQ